MIPITRLSPTWKKRENGLEGEKKEKSSEENGQARETMTERKKTRKRHCAEDGRQAIFGLHVLA